MKIIKTGQVYQLILPDEMVEALSLKNEAGRPIAIVHHDSAKLETLFTNIQRLYCQWTETINRTQKRRKRLLIESILGIILAGLIGIFHKAIANLFLLPYQLIAAFASIMVGFSCFRLWEWYMGVSSGHREDLPDMLSVIELRKRIEEQYGQK